MQEVPCSLRHHGCRCYYHRCARDFLQAPTPPPPPVEGAMNISAMRIFKAGMVPKYRPPKCGGGMVPEYQRLSRLGELWIDVKLLRDLGHQPLCDDGGL